MPFSTSSKKAKFPSWRAVFRIKLQSIYPAKGMLLLWEAMEGMDHWFRWITDRMTFLSNHSRVPLEGKNFCYVCVLALQAAHSRCILVNSKPQTARILLQLSNVRLLWHRWMSDLTWVMFTEPIIFTLCLHSIWWDLEEFGAGRLAEHRVAHLFDNIAAFQ